MRLDHPDLAACDTYAACERLDRPGRAGHNEHAIVPIASMYKVLLALEVAESFQTGALAPDAAMVVTANHHTHGGTGLNQFAHPATVALRDLLFMALAWSDNTASDMLLDLVGVQSLHDRAERLGLLTVKLVGGCQTLLSNAGADFGYPTDAAARTADWMPTKQHPDLMLERTTRASPADLVKLGVLLAADEAASPNACRLVRDLMSRQIWKGRLAEAFPSPRWSQNTKTGTLTPWRGEFGLIRRDDGVHLAVAVVVHQHNLEAPEAASDAAVRDAATTVVRRVLDRSEDS